MTNKARPKEAKLRCFLPVILRGLVFLTVGTICFVVIGLYARSVQEKVFDYRGNASALGKIVVFILFNTAELTAILVAISSTNFFDGKPAFRHLKRNRAMLAVGQKLLLASLVFQLLTLPVWHSFYLKSFGIVAFAIYLLTFGIGITLWRQFVWVCLGVLPTFSIWIYAVVGVGSAEYRSLLMMLLPVVLLLLQLIVILKLSQKASKLLREDGIKVRFFGVPFSAIPALLTIPGNSPQDNHTEAWHHTEVENENLLATPSPPIFYYLGPNNEPVGPISSKVLLQLWDSGTITDHTLAVKAGDTEWQPLISLLEH